MNFEVDAIIQCFQSYHYLDFISGHSCERAEVDIRSIALAVKQRAESLAVPKKIVVIGCVVNAAGEARETDYGIGCGKGKGAIFKKGAVIKTVKEENVVSELFELIESEQNLPEMA